MVKNLLQFRRRRFKPWVGKIPWRRKWQPTPVFLPGKSCGQRSLVGCSPWAHKESDMTEVTWHTVHRGLTVMILGLEVRRNLPIR